MPARSAPDPLAAASGGSEGDEVTVLRAQVQVLTAQLAAARPGRGRFALELDATAHPAAKEAARQRGRADRAEAALAELRRDSARAILGLRRRARFWQLVTHGTDPGEAAALAGLAGPLDVDDDPGDGMG